MEKYLVTVRDCLRDALGDHMVASTVFSKRIPSIFAAYDAGIPANDCARSLWRTEFAGDEGYEV
jgi:hypothetical protein